MYDVRRNQPDRDNQPQARSSWLPVLVVLSFGMTVMLGLVAIAGLAGLYIVLALAAVFGFAAFHYVLWGWWLTNKLRNEDPSREDGAR